MATTITVRGLTPTEKAWLQTAARQAGVSMEEFMRRLIRQQRERDSRPRSVSRIARRHFGPEHGVELPARGPYGYRPLDFRSEEAP